MTEIPFISLKFSSEIFTSNLRFGKVSSTSYGDFLGAH